MAPMKRSLAAIALALLLSAPSAPARAAGPASPQTVRAVAVASGLGVNLPLGALVAQGTGGAMRALSNAHFEDVIDSFVQAGFLPASIKEDGFIGSFFLVFNGFTKSGQGTATVRFFSSFAGGTI